MKKAVCCCILISLYMMPVFIKVQPPSSKKILIVYLSRTNNTRAIAGIIHSYTGGKLAALELQKPYPANYKATVQQVVNENQADLMPPLKTKIDSMEKFEVIFVGFPTWDMKIPPPIKSFLKQYNLNGKTVVPFNTNAGYGTGNGFETIKQLCPGSKVLEGFSTTGGIERDGILFVMKGQKEKQARDQIKTWLQKIKLIN